LTHFREALVELHHWPRGSVQARSLPVERPTRRRAAVAHGVWRLESGAARRRCWPVTTRASRRRDRSKPPPSPARPSKGCGSASTPIAATSTTRSPLGTSHGASKNCASPCGSSRWTSC